MQVIAEKAGVSTTTVSLALRGHSSISEETKKRIIEIQQSLGYSFNGRRGRSTQPYRPNLEQVIYRTVGVDMNEEHYAPFLAGVAAECRARGLKLELDSAPKSEFPPGLAANPGILSKRGVIISGRVTDQDIDKLETSGLPYVVLGNCTLSRPCHLIGVDLFGVAERAMRDLAAEGMKQAVFFVETKDRAFEREFLRYLSVVSQELKVEKLVVESGLGSGGIETAATTVASRLKPGGWVVALERHCAEAMMQSLRYHISQSQAAPKIATFVTSPPRLLNPGYRPFDMGVQACGNLAVVRLTELQLNPALPVNKSLIHSPGWIS